MNQGKDDQERINNFVLVVGLYNHYSCIPVANFFTINLPTGSTEDVRASALIPPCNTPIRWVRRRYCDVYTQVRNTLTYIAKHQYMQEPEYGCTVVIYIPAIITQVHSYHKA